jgi:DNA-binding response OmpR family regulator
MPADRWSAWERGASAYLAKPFTFEEVTSLVEHLLAPMEEGCAAPELADRLAVAQGGPHRLSRPSAVCSRA